MLVVEIAEAEAVGRGECVPYTRYGETVSGVVNQIAAIVPELEKGMGRADLPNVLPAGAARNAVDCALWDLQAKKSGIPVWRRAGLSEPRPLTTAVTLSLAEPDEMAAAARKLDGCPWLKVKLGRDGALERLRAVHEAQPAARIIVDANEAWTAPTLEEFAAKAASLGVALIEQPLPAAEDDALTDMNLAVPLCADESCHGTDTLERLRSRYQAVNIKLDKTGGLSEALELLKAARSIGFEIMIGCMVGTSLAMAPAILLAASADFVDLDGPVHLAADRAHPITYDRGRLNPAGPALWG